MPNPSDYSSQSEWMGACVPKMMQDHEGMMNDQAVAACMSMWEKKSVEVLSVTNFTDGRTITTYSDGTTLEFPQPGEQAPSTTKAVTKKEADGAHPAGHYLVVEDPASPSTWHLRVRGLDGQPDHRLMGAAWAALHGGYRGNSYEGPAKESAISKLRKLYNAEDMPVPGGKSLDEDTVINFGSEIKVLGEVENGVKVGGLLVRFGDETEPDLSHMRDFFTKDTFFGLAPDERKHIPVYFNHTMPLPLPDQKDGKKRMLLIEDEIGDGTIWLDDAGVMVEAVLFNRAEYEKALAGLTKSLGWSSGALGHNALREPADNNTHWVKRWIIGEASVTPTPAEYRNQVITLKSLSDNASQLGETTAAAQDKREPVTAPETTNPILGVKKMEITQELLDQMVEKAAVAGAQKAIEATEAAVKSAGGISVVTDEADQPFKSAGEFFMAVKGAALYPGQVDPRLFPLKATGLNEANPSQGGFLVQPTVAAGIVERMYATGSLLSLVARDPIGPNSNGMTYNAVDETSRATGSRFGGLQGYWLNEGGTKTASKPTFRQVNLKLKKVAAVCYATDELLADAQALESWLGRTVPEELRFMVEDAIYEGDGVGKPLGVLNSGALVSPARVDASEIDATDIATMWARRWTGVDDYVWLINQAVIPQLFNLVLGNFPLYVPAGVHGAPTPSIYGKPVIEIEYASALGTAGDIMLFAGSQYQMIEKGGIDAQSSIHVQFLADETVFRFVYRCDGAPMWNSALTAFKGSSYTVSPFVTLLATS